MRTCDKTPSLYTSPAFLLDNSKQLSVSSVVRIETLALLAKGVLGMFGTQRESQIERILNQIDGEEFQLLTEDYLQIKYPHVFHYLDPRGRRANGRSIRGSPDIIGRSPSGVIVLGEASKVDDWFAWVKKDIQDWGKRKREGEISAIEGFFVVSWHEFKPERGSDARKQEEAEQLAKQHLGLEPRDLVLIFHKQLVRDLAQPRFAQVVRKHLGLPWSSHPFTPVDEAPTLSKEEFAPTHDEFISGKVQVPPELVKDLDALLQVDHEVLVLGEVASGKTVLAWFYGFRHLARLHPALYLDCGKYRDAWFTSEILDIVDVWRCSQLLLLIDNVHLIPDEFKTFRHELRKRQFLGGKIPTSEAFSILYLGRKSVVNGKETVKIEPKKVVRLKADRYAFQAVYTRLAFRHNVVPFPLPNAVLDSWVEIFGSDLIAFAIAANASVPGLGSPMPEISISLALDSVRSRYLKPLANNPSAYHNFLTLCCLVELELRAPRDAFRTITPLASPFGPMVDDGVVYEERWIDESIYYDLPHPNLGSLILRADPSSPNRTDLLREACVHTHILTGKVLRRLYARDLPLEADTIENLFQDPQFFSKYLATLDVFQWYLLLRDLEHHASDTHQFLRGRLAQKENLDQLLKQAFETPLVHLTTFLRYAEGAMPALWELLEEKLAKVGYRQRLLSQALKTPLHLLKDFLYYAEKAMPKVAKALKEDLTEEESIDTILKHAFNTPLEHLRPFLAYIEITIPRVWKALKEGLAQEDHREHLLSLTLQTRLDGISAFLRYAENAMPEVARALKIRLSEEEAVKTLLNRALYDSPLSNLKPFLRYAENAMPSIANALKKGLAQYEYRERLLSLALENPLYHVKDFLIYAERSIPQAAQSLKEGLAREESVMSLLNRILETSLQSVKDFLQYSERAMPDVSTRLKEELSRNEHEERLLNLALETPLGDLATFLRYTEENLPSVWTSLKAGFGHEKSYHSLLKQALGTALEHLAVFLQYVENSMPQVATFLKKQLARKENRNRLLTRALETSLEHVAYFLRYAECAMPEVWRTFRDDLAKEKNRHRLVMRALNTPLEHLLSFLRYAENAMPEVWKILTEELIRDDNLQRLLKRTRETPSDHLANFLRYADVAMPEIAKAIRAYLTTH